MSSPWLITAWLCASVLASIGLGRALAFAGDGQAPAGQQDASHAQGNATGMNHGADFQRQSLGNRCRENADG
jgi:hypothetical protein